LEKKKKLKKERKVNNKNTSPRKNEIDCREGAGEFPHPESGKGKIDMSQVRLPRFKEKKKKGKKMARYNREVDR